MRVLVTGATGLVGAALLARLAADRRWTVRGVVRGPAAALPAGAERVVVPDAVEGADWSEALRGADVVVHLAARVHVMRDAAIDPLAEFRRVNVGGTLELARQAAAAGVRRLVFVSTVKVNGEQGAFTEADPPAPRDPYGISKHEAELGLRQVSRDTGLDVVIVRPPLVYGPGVRANFRALMRAVAKGLPLPLGAVHNRRSLVAVDNLADFIVVCLDHPAAANETFLVSDGDDVSTTVLVRRIAQAMGRRARLIPVPAPVLMGAATLLGRRDAAARLVGSLQVDISKARRLLAWTPPVTLDDQLRRAVASL